MDVFFRAATDAGFGHLPLPAAIDWNEKWVAATVLLRIVRGAFAEAPMSAFVRDVPFSRPLSRRCRGGGGAASRSGHVRSLLPLLWPMSGGSGDLLMMNATVGGRISG